MGDGKTRSRAKLTEMIDQRMLRGMKNLVVFFQVALKNARIYGLSNEAFLQPLRKFAEVLNSLLPLEGEVALRLADDYLFINEHRLRFDIEGYLSYSRLGEEMKARKIGSVIFREAIKTEDLQQFMVAFVNWCNFQSP